MTKKILTIANYTILLIVAVLLLLLAFRGMNLNKIIQGVLHAKIFWVAVSGVISIVAFFIRAYRWNLLIEPLGYSPSLKNTTAALMVGYFANLAFPRLGEVSRCGALGKAESIPFNKLLGTVIVERIIDVISLLICVLLVTAIEIKRLGNFFSDNVFNPIFEKFEQLLASPVLLIAIALLAAALVAVLVYFGRRKKGTETFFSKLVKGFMEGIRSIAQLKRPGLFIFHSVFIWVLYYLGVYVALFAFPFTNNLGPGAALFLLVAGGIGMSAPVQGGIGAYHLFVSQGLVVYGVIKEDGLAFATMLHGLQILLIIVAGVISLLLLFSDRKKRPGASQDPLHEMT